jgi:hypothetical protein
MIFFTVAGVLVSGPTPVVTIVGTHSDRVDRAAAYTEILG